MARALVVRVARRIARGFNVVATAVAGPVALARRVKIVIFRVSVWREGVVRQTVSVRVAGEMAAVEFAGNALAVSPVIHRDNAWMPMEIVSPIVPERNVGAMDASANVGHAITDRSVTIRGFV